MLPHTHHICLAVLQQTETMVVLFVDHMSTSSVIAFNKIGKEQIEALKMSTMTSTQTSIEASTEARLNHLWHIHNGKDSQYTVHGVHLQCLDGMAGTLPHHQVCHPFIVVNGVLQ